MSMYMLTHGGRGDCTDDLPRPRLVPGPLPVTPGPVHTGFGPLSDNRPGVASRSRTRLTSSRYELVRTGRPGTELCVWKPTAAPARRGTASCLVRPSFVDVVQPRQPGLGLSRRRPRPGRIAPRLRSSPVCWIVDTRACSFEHCVLTRGPTGQAPPTRGVRRQQ